MRNCLIVFAKEPRKGKVKTRLRHLSEKQRINLYKAFLRDIIALTRSIKCDAKVLAYESDVKPEYLRKIAYDFEFYKQRGRNLGYRMHNSFEFAQSKKASKTIIIGSDSPTLPAKFIKEAFFLLDKNDIVIGPSRDGGYYLIGLKKPCLNIFKGIKWSSSEVLEGTLKNIKDLKKKVAMLDSWYDVDEQKSLTYLKYALEKEKDKSLAKWTRKFLRI